MAQVNFVGFDPQTLALDMEAQKSGFTSHEALVETQKIANQNRFSRKAAKRAANRARREQAQERCYVDAEYGYLLSGKSQAEIRAGF